MTPTGKTGHIYTDYAECEITYTSAAQNTYIYDVDLKRIKKDVDGTVQKFIYDRSNVVAEYDGSNTLQASYITPGLDQNLTIKQLDFEFDGASLNVLLPRLEEYELVVFNFEAEGNRD